VRTPPPGKPVSPFRRRAAEPFAFADYSGLVVPTGQRAANLRELADLARGATLDVLQHHLHRAFLHHRFGVWDYPNDFAIWAARSLEDHALAEKLAAIDAYGEGGLERAREVLVDVIEEHLESLPATPYVRPGFEFHFARGHYLALPGEREVSTLAAMRDALTEVPASTLFYHFHEARLRDGAGGCDDFSRWIEGQFGALPIVETLRDVDFELFSLEELRDRLLEIFDSHRDGGGRS
jgi:hypothetical protein